MAMKSVVLLCGLAAVNATPTGGGPTVEMVPATPGSCSYPANCPMKVLPRPDTQSWLMNKS